MTIDKALERHYNVTLVDGKWTWRLTVSFFGSPDSGLIGPQGITITSTDGEQTGNNQQLRFIANDWQHMGDSQVEVRLLVMDHPGAVDYHWFTIFMKDNKGDAGQFHISLS